MDLQTDFFNLKNMHLTFLQVYLWLGSSFIFIIEQSTKCVCVCVSMF